MNIEKFKVLFEELLKRTDIDVSTIKVSKTETLSDVIDTLETRSIKSVDVNISETPSADIVDNVLVLNLPEGIEGPQGPAGPQGPQGPQGDSAVYNPSAPDTPDFEMANTTGQSTTKAMTQKAVTEMLDGQTEIYSGWKLGADNYYLTTTINGTNNGATYNTTYAYSDYIPLSLLGDNDTMILSNLVTGSSYKGGYYYNSSKELIISSQASGKITAPVIDTTTATINKANVPEGAAYIRINFNWSTPTFPVIQIIRRGTNRLNTLESKVNSLFNKQITVTSFTNGYIQSSNGQLTSGSNLKATGYIALEGAKAVHSSGSFIGGLNKSYVKEDSSTTTIAFYDSSKAYITGKSAHNKYATCPNNAAYIRCTVPSSASNTVITLYDLPTNGAAEAVAALEQKVNEVISTGLKGKRVAFIGDSITEASGITNSYHKVFADLAGCTNVNLGVNATCIANNTSNNTSANRFITRATTENLSNVDMVVVFGGTNDFSYDTKAIGDLFVEQSITALDRIGNKKRIPPSDTDTFAGALHELILQIRSIIGEKPIVFMTPLNRGRYSEGRPTSSECNVNGDYLTDFINAIKEICRFYGIPVFDSGGVMNFDPTDRNSSNYTSDLLHPNEKGHLRLGTLLYKWVCQNIFYNV